MRVKVKELIKSKSVTFEFIVSSDLNLSNKASSTEIISGGIWVTVCVNIMAGDDCGDDDDGVGGDRMSILLLILWHNYVYDDGDWGRGDLISAESSVRWTWVVVSRENLRGWKEFHDAKEKKERNPTINVKLVMIGIMIDDNKHLNEVITTLLFILKLKCEETENKSWNSWCQYDNMLLKMKVV